MVTTRRARRSAQEWSAIVSQFQDSGLSDWQFCEQQDLSIFTFRKWRYKQADVSASKSSRGSQKRNFTSIVVDRSEQDSADSVRIHLGTEVQIDCRSLSIDSVAQLALAVRDGR